MTRTLGKPQAPDPSTAVLAWAHADHDHPLDLIGPATYTYRPHATSTGPVLVELPSGGLALARPGAVPAGRVLGELVHVSVGGFSSKPEGGEAAPRSNT